MNNSNGTRKRQYIDPFVFHFIILHSYSQMEPYSDREREEARKYRKLFKITLLPHDQLYIKLNIIESFHLDSSA